MVNEYFQFNRYEGTLEYYLFELANFSFLAFLLLFIYKLKYINATSLVVWLVLFSTPLFLNYFLFDPRLFGDQFEYAGEVMSLKTSGTSIDTIRAMGSGYRTNDNIFWGFIHPITFAVNILGIAPLPNYMTVTSLAFANKFFLLLTFLWFKRFFKDENKVLFLFLVPSLVIYSSLALRDTLIIIISLVFIINLIRGNYIVSLILLYPIFILKIQMFFVLSLYLIGKLFFKAHKYTLSFSLFLLFIFAGGFILEDELLALLNMYRIGFAAEDFDVGGGASSYDAWNVYGEDLALSLQLESFLEAILVALSRLPEFLLLPMPWNWSNIFYPIQTIESCFLIYLLFNIASKEKLFLEQEFILLLFILLTGMLMYALVMANEGTFVRYRFAMYYPFLLASFYLTSNRKRLSKSD